MTKIYLPKRITYKLDVRFWSGFNFIPLIFSVFRNLSFVFKDPLKLVYYFVIQHWNRPFRILTSCSLSLLPAYAIAFFIGHGKVHIVVHKHKGKLVIKKFLPIFSYAPPNQTVYLQLQIHIWNKYTFAL